MHTIIFENWHGWQVFDGWLLSDENTKNLQHFPNIDALVNYLFVNGYKPAARHFNAKGK